MKKIITLLLSLAMVVSLVACGSGNSSTTTTTSTSNQTSVETPSSTENQTSASVEDNTSNTENNNTVADTIGERLYAIFTAAVDSGKKGQEITDAMAETFQEVGLGSDTREPGYLPGFSSDVTGFAHCYGANPWISTLPFACYVFELDTTDEAALNSFLDSITAISDPRWNICTEAGETIGRVYGGYVFFGMFPSGEDW